MPNVIILKVRKNWSAPINIFCNIKNIATCRTLTSSPCKIGLKFDKMCKKIVLKVRTVVSPGKIRYFWDFGWSYIQKLTSTTQNFHLGITFEISTSFGQPPHVLSTFLVLFPKIVFFGIFEHVTSKKLTSDRKLTSQLTSKKNCFFQKCLICK